MLKGAGRGRTGRGRAGLDGIGWDGAGRDGMRQDGTGCGGMVLDFLFSRFGRCSADHRRVFGGLPCYGGLILWVFSRLLWCSWEKAGRNDGENGEDQTNKT